MYYTISVNRQFDYSFILGSDSMKIEKIVVGPLEENCYVLRKDNKVSFCVTTEGIKEDEKLSWACTVKSVIIFGSIELIDNIDINNNELIDIIRKLCYKFTIDNDYIEKEIRESLKNTIVLKLDIKNICGKKVLEA